MNFFSYFFPKIIAKYPSEFNGEIKVMEFFDKKYLEVGNLEQSGPMMEKMFRKVFNKIFTQQFIKDCRKVLLLGVGGGTLVKLLKKINPNLEITGIEIDQQIVAAGVKHLGFKTRDIKIIYGDAFMKLPKIKEKYNLIIVDLFQGRVIPQALHDEIFLKNLNNHLIKNGYVIFNRLYFQKYKIEAENFLDKVKKIFKDVTSIRAFYNIIIKAN